MDHYEVLAVTKTASDKEIKDAYRRLVKKFHPDKNNSHEANQIIIIVNEAYDVLSDPRKRNEYDNGGSYSQEEYVYQEDPREVYRREYIKRKAYEAREERKARERYMAKVHLLLWRLSFLTAALGLLAMVDYYLPTSVYHEKAVIGWQQREGGSRRSVGHLVSYMQTKHFTFAVPDQIHLNYDYFEVEEKKVALQIQVSPILKVVTEVSINNWTFEPINTIYGGWNLFPKLLLFTSIFAIFMRNRWELYHVIALVPLIIAVLLLLIYFFK